MNLYKIETGNLKLDGGANVRSSPESFMAKKISRRRKQLANWAMRCCLSKQTDSHKIHFIDTREWAIKTRTNKFLFRTY